jgi:hypothetical protein
MYNVLGNGPTSALPLSSGLYLFKIVSLGIVLVIQIIDLAQFNLLMNFEIKSTVLFV